MIKYFFIMILFLCLNLSPLFGSVIDKVSPESDLTNSITYLLDVVGFLSVMLFKVYSPNKAFTGIRNGISFQNGVGKASKRRAKELVRVWKYECPELDNQEPRTKNREPSIKNQESPESNDGQDSQPDLIRKFKRLTVHQLLGTSKLFLGAEFPDNTLKATLMAMIVAELEIQGKTMSDFLSNKIRKKPKSRKSTEEDK